MNINQDYGTEMDYKIDGSDYYYRWEGAEDNNDMHSETVRQSQMSFYDKDSQLNNSIEPFA